MGNYITQMNITITAHMQKDQRKLELREQ